MIERADAVVVGGGILGSCAALHLLEAGVGRVMLLERDEVASGTTRAGAGQVAVWGAGYRPAGGDVSAHAEEIPLQRYGLDFYAQLDADGHRFGYRRNGTVWIARDGDAWDRHLGSLANSDAVDDMQVIDPNEIAQLTGIVQPRRVFRGVFHPTSVYLSAPLAARAVADRFVAGGGLLGVGRPVRELAIEEDRIRGVVTDGARVQCPIVVLAAGAWTNALLVPHGLRLPSVPLIASRVTTEPFGVPETTPNLLLVGTPTLYVREYGGGLLFGRPYDTRPRFDLVDARVPDRFDNLPPDGVEEIQRTAAAMADVVPALRRSRSSEVAHGAPTHTPDYRALVGQVGGIDGLYAVAGDNYAGVTHGPGLGRLLSELVSRTPSTIVDPTPFSPDRFDGRFATDRDVLSSPELQAWLDL